MIDGKIDIEIDTNIHIYILKRDNFRGALYLNIFARDSRFTGEMTALNSNKQIVPNLS